MASMQEIDSAVIRRLQQENGELQQQIDALKALLTSYRAFVLRPYASREKMGQARAGLLRITDVLLKDEQKEG